VINLQRPATTCEHVPADLPAPRSAVCEDCGSDFNLRMCATCAYVGCCESQLGHDRDHAFAEGHPVIVSIPVSKGFTWCYTHNAYV